MQLFLPYPDFTKSAKCLDTKKLLRQVGSARTIINVLSGVKNKTLDDLSFIRHPSVVMWWGCVEALKTYHNKMVVELYKRGIEDFQQLYLVKHCNVPKWLTDQRLSSSHRATLLYRDFPYYLEYSWSESPCNKYFWPTLNRDYVDILGSYHRSLTALQLCRGLI